MVDLANEAIISLAAATKFFPGPDGKRPHPSKVVRAAKIGSLTPRGDRIRLEHFRAGGRIYTSVEAVQRYTDRLTRAWLHEGPAAPSADRIDRQAHERAERELAAAGF